MNKKLFCDTLAHYASLEPKRFLQLDGHYIPNGGDDGFHPDEDGDDYHASSTVELMEGATVRVLIPFDTDVMVAVRQLKKIAKWLKKRPELIEYARPDIEPEQIIDDEIPF